MSEALPDYEAEFMARAAEILEAEEPMELGTSDEPEEEGVEEPVEEAVEDSEDSDGQEDSEDSEEDEDEEEDGLPKISVRVDGKKVDPTEVLKHMTFTPKVDGEEVEVDYEELIKGYQRGADYSKKTTEVSKAKEELQPYMQMVAYAKNDPQFVEYMNGYFQNGGMPASTDPDLRVSDADLMKLMDSDSDDYDPSRAAKVMKARADWQSKAHERQQVTQKVQQEMMARYNEWAMTQIEQARETIDSIAGEGAYETKGESVLAFLKYTGFNDDEISGRAMINATDARAAVLAFKAAEYDRMMRESEAPKVRLGKKRKRQAPPRTQASGMGTRTASSSKKQRDSYRKAVNSQKDDDWLSVIKGRMDLP